MQFTKMHGLGNDFMVIDAITQSVRITSDIIKKLGDRNLGVGFDQLLLIEPPFDPDLDFHYRIFNRDGSEVEQCGNGARCFAAFVHHKKLTNKKNIKVSTAKGNIILTFNDDKTIRVDMGKPEFEPQKIPFIAQKKEKNYLLLTSEQTAMAGVVSMGNPHCVVTVDNIETAPVLTLGKLLENHNRFPQKANIGFMQIINKNYIKLRVFERGCGETLACGSGACGAVAVGVNQGVLGSKVKVELKGGSLDIEYLGENHNLFMTGSANFVFDGEIDLGRFLTYY